MEWKETMNYLPSGYSPKIIENPEEINVCVFDGVTCSGVYVGFPDSMRLITTELKWRVDETTSEMVLIPCKELTLKEISDQVIEKYKSATVVVIINGLLHGEVYEYGNHGDYWEQIGVLSGYA